MAQHPLAWFCKPRIFLSASSLDLWGLKLMIDLRHELPARRFFTCSLIYCCATNQARSHDKMASTVLLVRFFTLLVSLSQLLLVFVFFFLINPFKVLSLGLFSSSLVHE